jgi:hypothetical protein
MKKVLATILTLASVLSFGVSGVFADIETGSTSGAEYTENSTSTGTSAGSYWVWEVESGNLQNDLITDGVLWIGEGSATKEYQANLPYYADGLPIGDKVDIIVAENELALAKTALENAEARNVVLEKALNAGLAAFNKTPTVEAFYDAAKLFPKFPEIMMSIMLLEQIIWIYLLFKKRSKFY